MSRNGVRERLRFFLSIVLAILLLVILVPTVSAANPEVTITVAKWHSAPHPPTDFAITQTSLSSINITWTPGLAANITIVRGSTTGYPFSIFDGSAIYSGNGTSVAVEDLDLTTNTYYYRAWGQNEYGTSTTYAQASIGAEAEDEESTINVWSFTLTGDDFGLLETILVVAFVGFALWKRGWIRIVLSLVIVIWGVFAMQYDIKVASALLSIGTVLFIIGITNKIQGYREAT